MLERAQLRGDVGEDAALGGDLVALADAVDHGEQRGYAGYAVGDGVDADDGIACSEKQAVEDGCGDAGGGVGGGIGLEARAEGSGQPYGGAEAGYDVELAGYEDEILQAHELGDGGGHLRGEGI